MPVKTGATEPPHETPTVREPTVAVLRLLKSLDVYDQWQNKPLPPHITRWLRTADEQELMTLTADALCRLLAQRR